MVTSWRTGNIKGGVKTSKGGEEIKDFRVWLNLLCSDQLEGPAIENNSFLQGHCIQDNGQQHSRSLKLGRSSNNNGDLVSISFVDQNFSINIGKEQKHQSISKCATLI